jgi:hypothetical protein
MASSVSSERVFSLAGITICKRRNRLDADIVEALQCLKCLIQQDLMVKVVASLTEEEQELDDADDQLVNQDQTTTEAVDVSRSCGILRTHDVRQGSCVGNGSVIQRFEVR